MNVRLRLGLLAFLFFQCIHLSAQIVRLDSAFNSNGIATINFSGSTDIAHAAVTQPDGKIVVAGVIPAALDVYEVQVIVARYNMDGSLDSTLGTNGKVSVEYAGIGTVTAVQVQADGKIIIAGTIENDFMVLRFNSNGALDSLFGTNGKVQISFHRDDQAISIALQPDGKIVVGGQTKESGSYFFAIARLNENGSLDPSFGVKGKVETGFPNNVNNLCDAVAVQPDGKILAAGLTYGGSINHSDFALIRFNNNGVVDSSFGRSGYIIDSINETYRQSSILVKNDSALKIISVICTGKAFITSRYNENGSIDTSFGEKGRDTTVTIDSTLDQVSLISTSLQPDGKILIGGYHFVYSTQILYTVVIRLNADGFLDTAFGENGVVSFASGGSIVSVFQMNERIISVGSFEFGSEGWDFGLVAYKPDNTIDSTFGNNGQVFTDFGNGNGSCHAIALQNDGKIVTAGYSNLSFDQYENDYLVCEVARMNSNGSLDSSFNSTGKISFEGQSAMGETIQPDGKILVGGTSSNSEMVVTRINPNGTINLAFGNNGTASHSTGYFSLECNAIALQSDGKILTAGDKAIGYPPYFLVHRFNADGSDDYSFGDSSDAILGEGRCESILIQPDGKILAAGIDVYQRFVVKEMNADGTLDTSFGSEGTAIISSHFSVFPFISRSISVQPDGKMLFAVNSELNHFNSLIRLNADGSRDLSFGDSGSVFTNVQNIEVNGEVVLLQPDNRILVAGYSGNEEDYTQSAFSVIRYNTDGSIDLTFGDSGIINNNINGYYAQCFAGALQPDNKILLAGYSYNGNDDDFAIVRYLNALVTGLINYTSPSVTVSYVYPNPVHAVKITLQYELPSQENISLSLHDSYGREIVSYFVNKESSTGKHSEELVIPDYCPSGFYILLLKTEHGNVSIKLNKQ